MRPGRIARNRLRVAIDAALLVAYPQGEPNYYPQKA